jgi:xanthine dehydrogenase YagT iron-sulfur-binding subunit
MLLLPASERQLSSHLSAVMRPRGAAPAETTARLYYRRLTTDRGIGGFAGEVQATAPSRTTVRSAGQICVRYAFRPTLSRAFYPRCVLPMNRRTFVGASIAVGGAVATVPLLAGCGEDEDREQAQSSVVHMRINGEDREITVDNRTSLLDMVRERVGLTGTKKGCDQGACGACTILVDGRRIVSCLTLAVMHDGAEITTIEGLSHNGRLHPLQQAFIDEDAFQCGYCTSGQIMSGVGCIQEEHTGSPAEIREWMSGNICRCGAYTNIVTAVANASRRA